MHSRAYLLLEREYLEQQKANLFGIVAGPVNDNLLEWVAKVRGLKDSLWEGGTIQLSIQYSEDYNTVPPVVRFSTIPFHPNVNKDTGRPCISFLDNKDEWDSRFSLTSILLAVQVMLSNPVLENAVNLEAAEMLRTSPSLFRQVVLDCVRNSRQLESGHSIHEDLVISPRFPGLEGAETGMVHVRNVKRISFEEYLKTWSGIATSKASQNQKNPLLEELLCDPYLHAMHYGLQGTGILEEALAQNEAFKTIMYGPAEKSKKSQITVDEKLARIHQMKRVYLLKRTPEAVTHLQSSRDTPCSLQREEQWEREVDNLVAWTNSLSLEELEED